MSQHKNTFCCRVGQVINTKNTAAASTADSDENCLFSIVKFDVIFKGTPLKNWKSVFFFLLAINMYRQKTMMINLELFTASL